MLKYDLSAFTSIKDDDVNSSKLFDFNHIKKTECKNCKKVSSLKEGLCFYCYEKVKLCEMCNLVCILKDEVNCSNCEMKSIFSPILIDLSWDDPEYFYLEALENKKYLDKYFANLTHAANLEHKKAIELLESEYCNGKDKNQSFSNKLIEYYKWGAKQKYSYSLNYLGLMYYTGMGLSKSNKMAEKYYLMAAKKNNSWAMGNLGKMYTDTNERLSFKFYSLGAKAGNPYSISGLANIYKKKGVRGNNFKIIMKAFSLFEKAYDKDSNCNNGLYDIYKLHLVNKLDSDQYDLYKLLKINSINGETPENCYICMDDPENILKLPCNHYYCLESLVILFSKNINAVNKCPYCFQKFKFRDAINLLTPSIHS